MTSGQRYHLRAGVLRVDVDAFDAHLRQAEAMEGLEALAEYERALAFYQGDFLGNGPFEWAKAYRREYQRRFLAATHQAARLAVESRDLEKAMELYRAILAAPLAARGVPPLGCGLTQEDGPPLPLAATVSHVSERAQPN